jgi:CHAT domain-containing protein
VKSSATGFRGVCSKFLLVSIFLASIGNAAEGNKEQDPAIQLEMQAVREATKSVARALETGGIAAIRTEAEKALGLMRNLRGKINPSSNFDRRIAFLNFLLFEYYRSFDKNTLKGLEYLEHASAYDSNWGAYKVLAYWDLEMWDELYKALRDTEMLEDPFDVTYGGCQRPHIIALGWQFWSDNLINNHTFGQSFSLEEKQLLDFSRQQRNRLYAQMFSNMDSKDPLCGRSNFTALLNYTRTLKDVEAQARLAQWAWSSFVEVLENLTDSEEFMEYTERHRPFMFDYLTSCWGIEESNHAGLDLYKSQCQENRFTVVELSTLEPFTAKLVENTWKVGASEKSRESIRELASIKASISILQAQLTLLAWDDEEVKPLNDEKNRLANKASSLLNRLTTDSPSAAKALKPFLLTDKTLRRVLREDEAIFLMHAFGTFDMTEIMLITKDKVVSIVGPLQRHISEKVQELRSSLDDNGHSKFNKGLAYDLYLDTIGSFSDSQLAGIKEITLISNGLLQNLPLSMMITEDPDKTWFDEAWAYKKFTFQRVPSLRLFYVLRMAKKTKIAGTFLGVGDPVLGSYSSDTRTLVLLPDDELSRRTLGPLPSLPDTRKELENLADLFDPYPSSHLLLGKAATKDRLRSLNMSSYGTIAFATHGLLGGDAQGLNEPALVLTPGEGQTLADGLLTASEIAKMDLNAELVILSACNTNFDDKLPFVYPPAIEKRSSEILPNVISGLSTAFFHAGAQSLMVTHWSIDSKVAAFITTTTIKRYRARPKLGLSNALTYTIDKVRAEPGWDHPRFWAPFSVIGATHIAHESIKIPDSVFMWEHGEDEARLTWGQDDGPILRIFYKLNSDEGCRSTMGLITMQGKELGDFKRQKIAEKSKNQLVIDIEGEEYTGRSAAAFYSGGFETQMVVDDRGFDSNRMRIEEALTMGKPFSVRFGRGDDLLTHVQHRGFKIAKERAEAFCQLQAKSR